MTASSPTTRVLVGGSGNADVALSLTSASPIERWLPSAGLAAALLICLAFPYVGIALTPGPFLIAAIALGLPHGAADGVILLRQLRWRARLARISGYLTLMVLAAVALVRHPEITLIGFLMLSWWHFGAADARGLSNDRIPAWYKGSWGFGRGGLAIATPFAVDPIAAWAPFTRLAELLGTPATLEMTWVGPAGTAATGAALLSLSLSAAVPATARPRAFEWIETGLILMIGLLADPLFAVGSYFLLVHGFRQSALLGSELMASRAASLTDRLIAVHRAALPLLIPSWLGWALLTQWSKPTDALDLAILSLAIYIIATPPHHLFHELSH
ncbi:MAG: Brp/Blh family beta-carotene 15,15'-dioxygenase [Acidobacteriota bacterium]